MMHVSANQKAVPLNLHRYITGTPRITTRTARRGWRRSSGGAVQVEFSNAADPVIESTRFQPLNLSSEKLVSKFAFKLNLYRYSMPLWYVLAPCAGAAILAGAVQLSYAPSPYSP